MNNQIEYVNHQGEKVSISLVEGSQVPCQKALDAFEHLPRIGSWGHDWASVWFPHNLTWNQFVEAHCGPESEAGWSAREIAEELGNMERYIKYVLAKYVLAKIARMVPDSEWDVNGLIGGPMPRCFIDEEEKMKTDLADIVHHALARDAFSIRDYAREHGLTYRQAKAEIARLLAEGKVRELIRLGSTERSARYVWT